MNRPWTEAGRRFRAARDVLLRHREDLDSARREFSWPRFTHFNWALDYFDPMAAENPGTALWTVGGGADVRYSFAELSRRSDQSAQWLRDQGVRRGDVLLVALGNRVELWEILLAAIKLGVVIVPTYVTATRPELADRIHRAGVRHIVAEAALAAQFDGLSVPGSWFAVGGDPADTGPTRWVRYPEGFESGLPFIPDGPTGADDPLFFYFTSGTTSAPKIVRHTHVSYPVGHLSGMYWNGVQPGDVHLNVSAPGWAKHAWSSFFVPWNAEATVLSVDSRRSTPAALLDILRTRPVTTFCAPPTVWRGMVAQGLATRPPRLREATSAGEPLDPELFATLRRAWDIEVRDGYGQTETTGQVGNPPGRPAVPGRMGWALPGYRIVVLESGTGVPVAPGVPGELCVELADRPAGMMAGYANDHAAAASGSADGYYHTGDLVVGAEDGSLRYVGRVDDMFKSFDHRISPLELERVLRDHPAVADAAVVPVPHPIGQWVPKAYVVPAAGWSVDRSTADAIFAGVRQKLPVEKLIHFVEFVTTLPRTSSGKVRRSELRTSGARTPGVEFHADLHASHGV